MFGAKMKYEDIKVDMMVTNGKVTGIVTHKYEIGYHKPIVVSVRTPDKFGTMSFWPAELEAVTA